MLLRTDNTLNAKEKLSKRSSSGCISIEIIHWLAGWLVMLCEKVTLFKAKRQCNAITDSSMTNEIRRKPCSQCTKREQSQKDPFERFKDGHGKHSSSIHIRLKDSRDDGESLFVCLSVCAMRCDVMRSL